MKFCEKCGAYMQPTKQGFSCPQCGNIATDNGIQVRRIEQPKSRAVDVVDESRLGYVQANEKCPHCGNPSVLRQTAFVSGEHAGIRQERSVEHLKCPKCGYAWTRD